MIRSISRVLLASVLGLVTVACHPDASVGVRRGSDVGASNSTAPNAATQSQPFLVACNRNFVPLSDAAAAALVKPAPEQRPQNVTANARIPTSAELAHFYTGELDVYGRTAIERNPHNQYVTGNFSGTTDEIIQWVAAKWGMPPDVVRAQFVVESYWDQNVKGDLTTVADVSAYPAHSIASPTQVYQSLSIAQVRWDHPDVNTSGIGTEPLRWQSTAFAADFYAATVRFYFDDPQFERTSWGDPSYRPCQPWLSVGGWFSPYPWNNPGQQSYVARVKTELANKVWRQPWF